MWAYCASTLTLIWLRCCLPLMLPLGVGRDRKKDGMDFSELLCVLGPYHTLSASLLRHH